MKYISKLIIPVALLIAVYHLANVFWIVQGATHHYLTHIGSLAVFVLLLMLTRREKKATRFLILGLITLTLISMTYIFVNSDRLEMEFGFINSLDMVIGALAFLAFFGVTWLAWGPVLPILSLICLLYFFFGHYIPGALGHPQMPPELVMSWLGMGISAGMFGYLVPLSANTVFLFMVLSGLFGVTKIRDLFLEIGKAAGNVVGAGPGYTAVVGSSLFGTVSGSAMANVIFTGNFTIPSMKARGYSPEHAAAIESSASSGGQIMPPIMGASAFVMAEWIGVSYVDIMVKGFLPAFMYFGAVALGVYLLCRRYKYFPPKEEINTGFIWRVLPIFVLPLGLLTGLLLMHYSPNFSAAVTILFLALLSLIQKTTRPSLKEFMKGIRDGVESGADIAVVMAVVGVISQTIITTGFGPKMAAWVMALAGDKILLVLFITMIMSLIIGTGTPTTAAYILVALVTVPLLIDLGINLYAAHFFCFYFAIFSTITPPVAFTSMAAAKIAGSHWWLTSLEALRLAATAFVIPFALVFAPSLITLKNWDVHTVLELVIFILATVILTMILYGFSLYRLNWVERGIGIASFVLFFTTLITSNYFPATAGLIGMVLVITLPKMRESRQALVN